MRSSANFTAIFQLSNARIICFRYFYTGTLATSLTFLRLLHKNVAKRTVAFVELFILGGRIGRWWLVRFSFPPEVTCFHTLPGHWHMNDPLLSILSWIRVNDMLRFTRRFFFFLLLSRIFHLIVDANWSIWVLFSIHVFFFRTILLFITQSSLIKKRQIHVGFFLIKEFF